ncbi:MAG: Crp/Fnr family transcriptional regulator [Rhodospirillales bacterium]|nr:Crp/Fnr family transcriptional regulator [Rhodospirillales bacterium]
MTDTAPSGIAILEGFEALEPEARRLAESQARPVSASAGQVLFRAGGPCQAYLVVEEGVVRVQKTAASGREIVLYRVEAGQTCVLTTACLLGRRDYDAEGIAETDIRALALPVPAFESLMAGSAAFRRFVFQSYASRVSDLLLLIEEVAFGRIDARLAQCLLARQDGAGRIAATHQELAVELGTAREVVSRQLKEFERQGWVRLARGRLDLVQPRALAGLAESKDSAR